MDIPARKNPRRYTVPSCDLWHLCHERCQEYEWSSMQVREATRLSRERDSCIPQGKITENHKIRLMEEIPNNHLGCIKPCKTWDKPTGARCLPSTVLVFSVHFIDWWVATTLQVRKPKSVVWPPYQIVDLQKTPACVLFEHVCLFWFPGFCSELVGNHSPNQQVSLVFILPTWPGSHAMWS